MLGAERGGGRRLRIDETFQHVSIAFVEHRLVFRLLRTASSVGQNISQAIMRTQYPRPWLCTLAMARQLALHYDFQPTDRK